MNDAKRTYHRDYARKRRYEDKVAARHGYRERARERKQELVAYKGGKCFDCGETFHFSVFHFDHRDPHEKSFTISNKYSLKLETLKKEADKCDLVCANCDALRNFGNEVLSEVVIAGRIASPNVKHAPQQY